MLGTVELLRHKLISRVNDGTMVLPASFNKRGPMPSGPVALYGSRDINWSLTSCSVALIDDSLSSKGPSFGKEALSVLMFECERKNVLQADVFRYYPQLYHC